MMMKITVENFDTETFNAATSHWSRDDKLNLLEWFCGKNYFISDADFDNTVAMVACILSEDKDNRKKIVDYINEKNRK